MSLLRCTCVAQAPRGRKPPGAESSLAASPPLPPPAHRLCFQALRMSFSLLFRMLATEKMKRYLYVSTHFRSCGTIHGVLEFKGQHGLGLRWGKKSARSLTTVKFRAGGFSSGRFLLPSITEAKIMDYRGSPEAKQARSQSAGGAEPRVSVPWSFQVSDLSVVGGGMDRFALPIISQHRNTARLGRLQRNGNL